MKFKFDRPQFIAAVRDSFGKLNRGQLDGFSFLLERIENDDRWEIVGQIAYFLATVWHETARTMKPITEYGGVKYFDKYDTGKLAKRLGNTPEKDGDGYKYRGRGFVQNTGKGNAEKAGRALAGRYYDGIGMVQPLTFVNNPDLLLNPSVSYDDAVDGMLSGRYTGVGLRRYVNNSGKVKNYRDARAVINGDVKKNGLLIAGYALAFERALTDAGFVAREKEQAAAAEQPTAPPTKTEDPVVPDAPDGPSEPQAAADKVTKLEIKDVTKHVSKETLRTVGPRILTRVGTALVGGIGSLWSLGIHGKLLVVLICVVIAACTGLAIYEIWKHRAKVRASVVKFIKGEV
jgi:hypothetical protein